MLLSVLEFELRKAQEMIKSLRATLTRHAGRSHCNTPPHPCIIWCHLIENLALINS